MKTKLLVSILVTAIACCYATAQVPHGFNYQAIARNGVGVVLADTPLTVRITIQTSLTGGSKIWEETHSIITNEFGAMAIVIGTGTWTGGSETVFSEINWSSQILFLKTEVDPGTGYLLLGTTKLWTVPYSMAAEEIAGSVDKLLVTGKTASMEEPLFEVKNNTGQTIFAVYNEGVRIYVSDGGTKGIKGGFAIGGFDMTKGVGEYLRVSRDSIRMYLNEEAKTKKGGFAIGSFDREKGVKQDYLIVDQDSIRMYIRDAGKYRKGGFAIGGFGNGKADIPQFLSVNTNSTNVQVNDSLKGFSVTNIQGGGAADFIRMNKVNYFLGHESGSKTVVEGDNGKYNSFLGYMSGHENVSGKKNVFLGYKSGYKNNANYNVFVGNETGAENTSGDLNVFIGHQAGFKNNTGLRNSFLGYSAGNKNTTGFNNVYMGYYSGGDNQTGDNNTIIGSGSGFSQTAGSRNVFIGSGSGSDNFTGSGNVFIGYKAGADAYNVSNQLNIANSNTHTLITGTFGATDAVSQVDIKGSLFVKGALLSSSDIKLKTDLIPLINVLEKILSLNAYYFFWNQESEFSKGMCSERQIGLLAQEMERVFPELVKTDDLNIKSLDYTKIAPILIQAIKEQNGLIENQKTELEKLRNDLDFLKSQISDILKNKQ